MAEYYPVEERSRRWRRPHSIFWPLLLITLGVIFLLDQVNAVPWNAWEIITRFWPVLFIVGGLDNLYQGESYVGSALSIGFGGLILLANLGYFPVDAWSLVLRFWPVLIIAWGLDLVIGRRSVISAAAGILTGVLLTALIVWMATNSVAVAGGQPESFSQALQGAEQADVRLEMVAADARISGGVTDSSLLLEGEAQMNGRNRLESSYRVNNGRGSYQLKENATPFIGMPGRYRWDVSLNDSLPLDLNASMVLGSQTIDLNQLKLRRLDMNTVLGQTTLNLTDELGEGNVSVVLGSLVIIVPRDQQIVIDANTAMTVVSLPAGYQRDGNLIYSQGARTSDVDLEINVPLGSVSIRYAD